MDNLKLITRIAEIENLDFTVDNGVVYTKQLNDKYDSNIPMPYDPMDDGVNHRLMIKYQVQLGHENPDYSFVQCEHDVVRFIVGWSPNRAILLAIEAAHSD